jgi:dTDP-4-amino-4,6-dideoxygalactose transaminase
LNRCSIAASEKPAQGITIDQASTQRSRYGLPVSDRVAEEVLSLPMHPYLEPDEQEFIGGIVKAELR